MHCLSSVYWVITPLHVSGVSAAHYQEVEYIYVYICGKWYLLYFWADCQRAWVEWNRPFVAYIHSTSWWWAADMPETCSGVVTEQSEGKSCIVLVIIHVKCSVITWNKQKVSDNLECRIEFLITWFILYQLLCCAFVTAHACSLTGQAWPLLNTDTVPCSQMMKVN
jgi:hypothetical protein